MDTRKIKIATLVFNLVLALGIVTAAGPANAQAATTFPIANTSRMENSMGAAFDGTNFLVGIADKPTPDPNNTNQSITAQLVSKTGALVGPRISTGAIGGGSMVAFDGTNYLLVYEEITNNTVAGQFVNTSGALVGSPFNIVTTATDRNLGFARSLLFDGTNYFVVWQSNSTAGNGDTADVFGQYITPGGAKLGSVVSISTAAHGQSSPVIAFDGANILAVWVDGRNQSACPAGQGCEKDVYGQLITKSGASAAGTLSGSNFLIDAGTLQRNNPMGIAFDGTNYLVTFTERNPCPSTGCNWEAYGILVSKTGATIGSKFVLGNTTTSHKILPLPTYLGTQYLVTWTEGLGTTSASVKGQYVTTSGAVAGSEFMLFAPAPSGAVPWLGMVFSGGGVNLAVTNWGIPDATNPENIDLYTSADVTGSIITTPAVTLNFVPSWNLVGNSVNTPLTVAATFGDATKIQTVWKWIPATSKWAFYTPTMTDGGSAYAAGKGYDFLTTINGGEGFWVNAKVGFAASLPAGTTVTTASFQDQVVPPNPLPAGWSLISVGDNPTPLSFNNRIGYTQPATGIVSNLVTLWAWDSASTSWYFYAPSLDANGTLANYITGKNYLNFGAKVLDTTMGFWVNRPASAGAPSTTAVAIASIQTQMTAFQNLFATAKPAATDPALAAFFDASFLDNGMDKAAFLAMLVDPNQGLNVGDQFVGVAAVTPLDAGAVANDATHQWFTSAIQSAGGYVSHDHGGGAWLAIKDATTGNWLSAGNRRHVGISVSARAEQNITMGATTFSSRVNFDLYTGTGGGSGSAALAAAGVTSALVTGPGVVSTTGATLYSSATGLNWVPPCGSQGPAGTITTDCMDVSLATAGSHYTFRIFTAAGGATAPAYTYTDVLYAAPVPVAGLTAANFPAITSVTPTTFASGATVTVNWTLPAGLKPDWLEISGNDGQLFKTLFKLSGAALTKSFVVPAYTGTLSGAYIYLQARDVNGMSYETMKQY